MNYTADDKWSPMPTEFKFPNDGTYECVIYIQGDRSVAAYVTIKDGEVVNVTHKDRTEAQG